MAHPITINASDNQQNIGSLLTQVDTTKNHLILERDGTPIAVMISYEEYQAIYQKCQEIYQRSGNLANFYRIPL